MDDDDDMFIIQNANSFFTQTSVVLEILLDAIFNEENEERIMDYAERVVPGYSETKFRETFRLSRGSFEHVFGKIAKNLAGVNTGPGRPALAADKTFLCGLYMLANPTAFRYAKYIKLQK